jgi:4-hydroxy-tetrahydrodipicolinate synthase
MSATAIAARATSWLAGYIPDLPTPFDPCGKVDLNAFRGLCERQIEAGAPALVVCETAGETSTVSPTEQETIIRVAVDAARGRARIIAGAGSNSTSQAIELTRRAEATGADAILSVVPYYNRPMQSGIHAHFRAIADSTRLPIVLHDIPLRTNRELADDTLARLAESRQFIGLRDGSGDASRPIRLSGLLPSHFRLLTGDDAVALAYMANGGDGCISTVCNVIPDVCRMIFSNWRQGLLQTARDLQRQIAPLEACLSRNNPAALKYAVSLLGFIHPDTRLPIVELDEPAKAALARIIAGLDHRQLAAVRG